MDVAASTPIIADTVAILTALATVLGGALTAGVVIWRLSAFKTSVDAGLTSLKEFVSAQIQALATQITELKGERKDHERELRELRTDFTRLDTRLKTAEGEIRRLRGAHSDPPTSE